MDNPSKYKVSPSEQTAHAIEERRRRLGDRLKPNGTTLHIQHLRDADRYDHPHLRPPTVEKGEWGYVLIQAIATFVASMFTAAGLSFAILPNTPSIRNLFAYTPAWSIWTGMLASILLVTWFVIGSMHFKAKGWLLTGVIVVPVVAGLIIACVALA